MQAVTTTSPRATLSANPWPTLESAGLLGVNVGRDRPLAGTLDVKARAGLEDVVERVTQAGGSFELERNWAQSKLLGGEYAPLSTDEVVPLLARQPLPFKDALKVNIGGQKHLGVYTLEDLRSLDIVYGLGVAAAGTQAPVARALHELIARGWSFKVDRACYDFSSNLAGPYPALAALQRGQEVRASHADASPTEESRWLRKPDDLVTLAYFQGAGTADDLAERSLAEGLFDLERRGYRFNAGKSWRPDHYEDAYEIHTNAGRGDLLVGKPGDVMVAFDEADLADIPGLEQRIQEASDLYARFGKPVLERLERTSFRQSWMDAVMRDETCPALSREARADLLGVLMDGQVGRAGNPVLRACADFQALARRILDPEQLRTEASWLAGLRAACSETGESSDETLDRIRDRLWLESGSPEQYAQARQHLLRLAEATGNIGRACEAFHLVHMPLGPETVSERIAMIARLAASAPTDRGEAPLDLQCLLIHRLGNESVDQALSRLCETRRVLTAAGQGHLTREFFAIIQENTRAAGEGPEAADKRLGRLVEAIPIQRNVEVALDSALHSADGRIAGPQTVEVAEDGSVVVGGIRIPTRSAGPTPGERQQQEQGGEPA